MYADYYFEKGLFDRAQINYTRTIDIFEANNIYFKKPGVLNKIC